MENLTKEEIDLLIDMCDFVGMHWGEFLQEKNIVSSSAKIEIMSDLIEEKLQNMRY